MIAVRLQGKNATSNATNVKISTDVCEWYIVEVLQILHWTSIEHRVESIQIFIKTTSFLTTCQSQSATGNKTWTSTAPNFVNNLAQSCVGNSQRSYVNSIHISSAPTFASWLLSYLTLTWWKPFLKSTCLVRPHNPRNRNFDCQYFDNLS